MNDERQANQKQEKKQKKFVPFPGVVASDAGSHTMPVYKQVYDEELKRNIVKKVDEFDLFEFIQASASQTDFALLEKRFVELGEIPQFDPSLGENDLTNMPGNIHEVYAMANDIADNFAKLPQSIQTIFGTKEAYMKALLDGSYQATIVNYINAQAEEAKKKKEEPKPEPKEEK